MSFALSSRIPKPACLNFLNGQLFSSRKQGVDLVRAASTAASQRKIHGIVLRSGTDSRFQTICLQYSQPTSPVLLFCFQEGHVAMYCTKTSLHWCLMGASQVSFRSVRRTVADSSGRKFTKCWDSPVLQLHHVRRAARKANNLDLARVVSAAEWARAS